MSLFTCRLILVDTREVRHRSRMPTRAEATMMSTTRESLEVWYPVMMSMVYLLATADTSPKEALSTPSRM